MNTRPNHAHDGRKCLGIPIYPRVGIPSARPKSRFQAQFAVECLGDVLVSSQISPPRGEKNFPPTASRSMPVQVRYSQRRRSRNAFKALKAGQQRYQ
eukprot:478028-Rhodomonas_salina.1